MNRRRPRTEKGSSTPPSSGDVRADMMRDISRLLGDQNFDSIEDVNAFLQDKLVGKPIPRVQPTNDSERAEDIVIAASGMQSLPKLRAEVARALALDPNCISAHLLLAETAETPAGALAHSRDAIAAGERILSDVLSETEPVIWYHPKGRTYMQARRTFAEMLWDTGDKQLALVELHEMLRINRDDNQGNRYLLLEWLMHAGSVNEIDTLLAAYDDASAVWKFGRALHHYRTQGPSRSATKTLRTAMSANVHIVPMMLDAMRIPKSLPDAYSIGSKEEAAIYVQEWVSVWFQAIGAIEWLEDNAPQKRGGRYN